MGRIDKIQLGDTVYNLGVNAENIEGKVPVDLDDYYNKEETNGLLEDKQDKLTAGINITIDENNVISASGGGEIDADEIPCYIAQVDESGVFSSDFLDNSKNGEQVSKNLTTAQKNAIAGAVSKAFKDGRKKMQLMLLFNNGSGILFDNQSGNLQSKPEYLYFSATGFTNAFNTNIGVYKMGYVTLELQTSWGTDRVSFVYNTKVKYYYNNVADIPNITYLNNQLNNKQNKLIAGEGITITGNTISASGGGGSDIPIYYVDASNITDETRTLMATVYQKYLAKEPFILTFNYSDKPWVVSYVKEGGSWDFGPDGMYWKKEVAFYSILHGDSNSNGYGTDYTAEIRYGLIYYPDTNQISVAQDDTLYLPKDTNLISIYNNKEYEVTGNYTPAHKKYVDDSIKNYVDNLNSNEVSY